ncbi:glycine zipper 2TM domain-containing protein [Herbaspirillum huttiense F1]|uniref:Glycine zipper 2TM domain-containing protein n=1 Tax=Herbaspirillum huttiense subsp. lycopersici TaxID=3074428 RepID=A0ABU2EGU1_9BURK|nr:MULTISPECIES: glycine zipper 2TM domain-containing protein [Herbaspirillum]MBP1313899.1 outer membrane lipoprotein SlyB [Herbaspirillum sp. 1130]MCO4856084.1 glycine zipper 2TM domain-containing protein [Herbaspirillum sp. WGmk3]MDR6739089.1 outer membrane lipoprotein SlyB [Herbaspirillum sp. 1173]MDR9847354.1 glycine zipper 2TM domain-containing protein [Herbaspirillum huttiense SE1]MDT0354827.1 glycine zipper 2TM domain-containing protein [Herbaspirillum huttiense F1]
METNANTNTPQNLNASNNAVSQPSAPASSGRIHPLVAGASVAVILVSLIGVAAMTGLLPSSKSANSPQQVAAMEQAGQPGQAAQGQQPLVQQQAPQSTSYQPQQGAYPAQAAAPVAQRAAAVCSSCGEVIGVRTVRHSVPTSGVGIAGGAVVGGLLGNQIGGGTGRTLATIAGAVGGGYAGNEVEKNVRSTTSYVVDVRMDNGKTRSFPQTSENWRVGDQVRVVNGRLEGRG